MNKIIIDQRQEADFLKEHLPGAINIPMQIEGDKINVFNMDLLKAKVSKDDLILLYCYGGDCAGNTVKKLQEDGYKRVVNLGGYDELRFDGNPKYKIQSMLESIKEYNYKMLLAYGVEKQEDLELMNSLATIFDSTLTATTFVVFPTYEGSNVKEN